MGQGVTCIFCAPDVAVPEPVSVQRRLVLNLEIQILCSERIWRGPSAEPHAQVGSLNSAAPTPAPRKVNFSRKVKPLTLGSQLSESREGQRSTSFPLILSGNNSD